MTEPVRWRESQPLVAGQLDPTHVRQWREAGFTLVHDLIPQTLLHTAAKDALAHYPSPGSEASRDFTNFGSSQRFVFPSDSAACNEITLHPNLLAAVAALLGVQVGELRLTQSDLWPKYGREPGAHDLDNADQRIHCDYPNHSLTHPPPWDQPEAVEIILYLSEFAACEGGTAVVPRTGPADPAYQWPIINTPGVAGLNYVNDKQHAEAYLRETAPNVAEFREEHLYAREVRARYQFGSVLFYRHDTWHRGTPVKNGGLRLVHNLTFKKASSEWVNVLHPGWSWSMYRRNQFMEKLIARASVEQRAVLGFPLPTSPYWNADTVAAVAARYGAHGMDITPYATELI